MKIYQAKLVGLSDVIEEEVSLEVRETLIVGFATMCPYKITLGETYPVDIGLTFLDSEEVMEFSENKYGLERVGDTYQYVLYGRVVDNSIDIGNGIKIYDDYFKENSYLSNKFIKVIADRISISFLSQDATGEND